MKGVLRALLAALVLVVLSGCAAAGSSPQGESAEDYPSDDIRLIIPYAAGGPTDVAGRAVAAFFEENLGQSVVVENKVGASGTVGTNDLVGSEPDGYTIEMATTSPLVLVPFVEDVPYDKDDVETIGAAIQTPAVLAVKSDSEFETAEQFFEAAKQAPGDLSVGLPGANTPQGVELRRLKDEYGVEVKPVPFNGDSEAVTALRGGNIDALFDPTGEVVLSPIQEGDFRALAVGPEERLEYLPDTPTLKELGYENLTLSTSTYGLVAPKGISPEIISKLESTLKEALQDPEVRKQIGERYIPEEFIGSEGFRQLLDETYETYEPILGQNGG
ncbi:MAG: tripartite tricarboxylate transporter substrate binding protein [Actinomycetota bacterium]|nr:tripartite tricarboxylate transporter substrate binding protein [Actinomycetota bacterium]